MISILFQSYIHIETHNQSSTSRSLSPSHTPITLFFRPQQVPWPFALFSENWPMNFQPLTKYWVPKPCRIPLFFDSPSQTCQYAGSICDRSEQQKGKPYVLITLFSILHITISFFAWGARQFFCRLAGLSLTSSGFASSFFLWQMEQICLGRAPLRLLCLSIECRCGFSLETMWWRLDFSLEECLINACSLMSLWILGVSSFCFGEDFFLISYVGFLRALNSFGKA